MGRQVGEEVVLDLIAEVSGHEVENRSALDVGRAQDLAEVPAAPGLIGRLVLGGGVATPSGKCPQKITVNAHTLRVRLAVALAAKVMSPTGR